MNRICLLFLFLVLFFGTSAHAQDFSFNDLIKLRASSLPDFETAVMDKGYELIDVTKDDDQSVKFRKGKNVIIYSLVRAAHSQVRDTVVTYRLGNMDDY